MVHGIHVYSREDEKCLKKKKIIKRGQVAHIIMALCWVLILVIDSYFGM
jgi:hypothetical protein